MSRAQEREERRARFEAIKEQQIAWSLEADQRRAEYIESLRIKENGDDLSRQLAINEAQVYIKRLRNRHKMGYEQIAQRTSERFPILGNMTWYKVKDALDKPNGEWRPR